MKSPQNLYVIGNGFDIHHKINSSYVDFREWLNKNHMDLMQRIDDIYGICSDEWWSDFENQLASLDILDFANRISCEYAPDLTDDHCDRMWDNAQFEVEHQLGAIYSELKGCFHKWIMQLNAPNPLQRIKLDLNNALFLNFNYTKTLEDLYGIDSNKILHIHGCIDDDEDFIIGHGKTYEELEILNAKELFKLSESMPSEKITQCYRDYCSNLELHEQWAKDATFGAVASLRKPVEELIKMHEDFLNSLSDVCKIYVYGLSLSEIDIPYLTEIASKAKHVVWEFSYYSEKDRKRIESFCLRHNVVNYNIIKLNDLIESIYGKEK